MTHIPGGLAFLRHRSSPISRLLPIADLILLKYLNFDPFHSLKTL